MKKKAIVKSSGVKEKMIIKKTRKMIGLSLAAGLVAFNSFVTPIYSSSSIQLPTELCAVYAATATDIHTTDLVKWAKAHDGSVYKGYGGLCLKWVFTAFKEMGATNAKIGKSCCCAAAAAEYMIGSNTSATNIPVGAIVFFAGPSSQRKCSCGRRPGHTGIYIGNNEVISMHGNGTAKITSLDYWNNAGYKYLGYGFAKNVNLVNDEPAVDPFIKIVLTRILEYVDPGKIFSLRGTITSDSTILEITGQIIDSFGNVVQETKDYPNASSVEIRGLNCNQKLLFQRLKTGYYKMVITVTSSTMCERYEKDFRVGNPVVEPPVTETPSNPSTFKPATTIEEVIQRLNEMESIFNGMRWGNTDPSKRKTGDQLVEAVKAGYTNMDNNYTMEERWEALGLQKADYATDVTSNNFYGGVQCYGYAKFVLFALYGVYPNCTSSKGYSDANFTCYSGAQLDGFKLQPGDFIRNLTVKVKKSNGTYSTINLHAGVVRSVEGDKVYVTEANVYNSAYAGKNRVGCWINWSDPNTKTFNGIKQQGYYFSTGRYYTNDFIVNDLVKASGGYIMRYNYPNSNN